MAKIMLVEDDNNLREIYEARLLAEGYEVVSAEDGEQALALAVKEKPDLIISDIMMPKISGFDMLDILRSTPETRDTKIIMMTALSQAEDKERASKLGADRYLVKSQVTLEDVAKVAREVLSDEDTVPAAGGVPPNPGAPGAPPPDDPAAPPPTLPVQPPPPTTPPAEPPAPPASTPPTDDTTSTSPISTAEEQAEVKQQIDQFVGATPTPPPQQNVDRTAAAAAAAEQLTQNVNQLLANSPPAARATPSTPAIAPAAAQAPQPSVGQIAGKKVISPITDMNQNHSAVLHDLLIKEEEANPPAVPILTPMPPPEPENSEPGKPTTSPGNVINPGDPDPNAIAL